MTEPADPRNPAAEAIYDAIFKAQRDAGDVGLCEALEQLTSTIGENRR